MTTDTRITNTSAVERGIARQRLTTAGQGLVSEIDAESGPSVGIRFSLCSSDRASSAAAVSDAS